MSTENLSMKIKGARKLRRCVTSVRLSRNRDGPHRPHRGGLWAAAVCTVESWRQIVGRGDLENHVVQFSRRAGTRRVRDDSWAGILSDSADAQRSDRPPSYRATASSFWLRER